MGNPRRVCKVTWERHVVGNGREATPSDEIDARPEEHGCESYHYQDRGDHLIHVVVQTCADRLGHLPHDGGATV
jgi:hypothetical protein